MGQIDRSRDKPVGTKHATTAEVYNWRTNVLTVAITLTNKLDTYTKHLARIKETYPDEWVEPPETFELYGYTWTHEQFAVTVYYNGSSYEKGVTATMVYGHDKNGKLTATKTPIYCPLVFHHDKSEEERWEPCDNAKFYAQRVAEELLLNPTAIKE